MKKYWVVINRKTKEAASTFADGTPLLHLTKRDAFYTPEYCCGNNKDKYMIVRAEVKILK